MVECGEYNLVAALTHTTRYRYTKKKNQRITTVIPGTLEYLDQADCVR